MTERRALSASALSEHFRWLLGSAFRWWSLLLACIAVAVAILALSGVIDAAPLKFVGAALFWGVMAWYWTSRAPRLAGISLPAEQVVT